MNVHVLIVEDDPIFTKLMEVLLRKSDFHTSPVAFKNGGQAINYLKEQYNNQEAFVVFLDINMPEMNGWEFLKIIESFTQPVNTFVFMVTSSIDNVDRNRALENRFVLEFLSKPVHLETFNAAKKRIPHNLDE